MAKLSLLQGREQYCWACRKTETLHKHHIYYGPNRKNSEKYGCFVWLCPEHHNMSDEGVHFNKQMDMALKSDCQRAFEEIYGHKKFMYTFTKNYLDEEEWRE